MRGRMLVRPFETIGKPRRPPTYRELTRDLFSCSPATPLVAPEQE
jgi:hypothetical protein